MKALEAKMDAILGDPLREARAHGAGVGYVGPDIPLDVLLAAKRPVAHLPWHAESATPFADRWLESSFPGWARSILEDWHHGRFRCLSQVVFSRACDASQRLYYYVCELQRRGDLDGPEALIFDMALVPRETSLLHTTDAVSKLCRQLGVDTGVLGEAIVRANRQRRMFDELQAARMEDGEVYEKIARASLYADVAPALGGQVSQQAASTAGGTAAVRRRRLVLAGSAPPDGRLHRAAADAGAAIVAEAHVHGLMRLGLSVDEGATDPARAIALHLRSSSIGPRSFIDRATWLLDQARRAHADAVVLWLTREDEALGWHVPAQRKVLEEAGLPTLVLTGRHWSVDDGAGEAIAAFAAGAFA
jgi:2-hydroxyglutaryl-CoA dehydratase, D-component